MRNTDDTFLDFYRIQGLYCTHDVTMFYGSLQFFVIWFWCMDVAILNAEENTEPLQSPQPG